MKPFDVFLSYNSRDASVVLRICESLERRGVKVWMDRDQIRPGDHFAAALENGLAQSRSVVLCITPESMKSSWVKDEYYRALSLANEKALQLIPVLLEDAILPGFLSTRHCVNIGADRQWDRGIDRIVWPGVTGKTIVCCETGVGSSYLEPIARAEGLKTVHSHDIDRTSWFLDNWLKTPDQFERMVVFVDPFEGRESSRDGEKRVTRNTVGQYLHFIFDFRKRTRETSKEIVFVIYSFPDAWLSSDVGKIPPALFHRLQHYFQLDRRLVSSDLEAALRTTWNRVQSDLLVRERLGGSDAEVEERSRNFCGWTDDTRILMEYI